LCGAAVRLLLLLLLPLLLQPWCQVWVYMGWCDG
jgi:hypothetical protein